MTTSMTLMTFFTALLQNFDLLLFFINLMDQFSGILDNFLYLVRIISVSIMIITLIMFIKLYVKRRKVANRQKAKRSDIIYNSECPICYDKFTLPIKAGCGHAYCMDCLYQCWKTTKTWESLCPLCRAPIIQLELVEQKNHSIKDSMKPYAIKIMQNILSTSFAFQEYCYDVVKFGTFSVVLGLVLALTQCVYSDWVGTGVVMGGPND